MNAVPVTFEPRGDLMTNRCIELLSPNSNEAHFSGWRNEVRMSLCYDGVHSTAKRQLKNGLEVDIILRKKPQANRFVYSLNSMNLQFYKQKQITERERLNGAVTRAPWIVNSIAVYHSKARSNVRLENGKRFNYLAGKFCHIYRPLAIDATHNKAWCDLDVIDNQLVVTVPEDFLERATYPVRVDPVIGYDTVGASPLTLYRVKTYNNMANQFLESVANDSSVSFIYAYAVLQSAGQTDAKACLWRNVADPDKENSVKVAETITTPLTSETAAWCGLAVPAENQSISGGYDYGPGFTANKYFSPEVSLYYDSIAPTSYNGQMPGQSTTSGATTSLPATLGTTGQSDWHYSLYAEYSGPPQTVSVSVLSLTSQLNDTSASNPMGKVDIASGWRIGTIKIHDNYYQGEVRSRQQHLSQRIVNLYSPTCRAQLGDAACGVDLSDSAQTFWHAGIVSTITEARRKFTDASVPSSITEDVFRFGLLTWSVPTSGDSYTGNNASYEMEVKSFNPSTGEFELFEAMPYDIEIGDEFTVTFGCDKTKETCKNRFNNLVNFRGEPFLPGWDSIKRVQG